MAGAKLTVHVLEHETWAERPTDDLALMPALVSDHSLLVWIDIEGDPPQAEEALREVTRGCSELRDMKPERATEGGDHPPRRPPKAKAFGDAIFARAYWLGTATTDEDSPVKAQEVHILAGPTFAITMRYPRQGWDPDGRALGVEPLSQRGEGLLTERLREDVVELRERLRRTDGREAFGLEVAASLLDEVVDSVFDVLNALRLRVDRLEEEVVAGKWLLKQDVPSSGSLPERTLGMRKLLRQIRWAFLPSDEITELLSGPFLDLDDDGIRFRFGDLSREADRAVTTVHDVIDQLQQTVELSNTMKADRLNDTIYLLTVIATVLLVPTLVAGVFGMNFVDLPGTHSRIGFWGSLFGMAVLGVAVWFGIRRYLRYVYGRRLSGTASEGEGVGT